MLNIYIYINYIERYIKYIESYLTYSKVRQVSRENNAKTSSDEKSAFSLAPAAPP